jgi:hypothetical protein
MHHGWSLYLTGYFLRGGYVLRQLRQLPHDGLRKQSAGEEILREAVRIQERRFLVQT